MLNQLSHRCTVATIANMQTRQDIMLDTLATERRSEMLHDFYAFANFPAVLVDLFEDF